MRRIIFYKLVLIALMGLGACADDAAHTNKTKEETKMQQRSLLYGRPAFRINLSCENSDITIYLNGVEIFERYGDPSLYVELPVNDLILRGENELALLVDPPKGSRAECSADLVVREFNNFDMEPLKILTLHYDEKQKHPTEGTTHMGSYSSYDDFEPSDRGDVHVGAPVVKKHKKSATYGADATFVRLKFDLPTPFGRWKYAEGLPILDKPFLSLTLDEYVHTARHDPKFAKLYEINHRIYKLVKAKDIDALMPYFRERNLEMDRAFFRSAGTTERGFREDFLSELNDPDMELLEISEEKWKTHNIAYRVDDNNKLAWLTDLIIFNRKQGDGSSTYTMKFRWDGKEWILTR